MPKFQIRSDFKPTGDQPQAIEKLSDGIIKGLKHQVLLGVTGSGKTFTMAKVIEALQRPALILAHNKTLAAQLYREFKSFFPANAVEYFLRQLVRIKDLDISILVRWVRKVVAQLLQIVFPRKRRRVFCFVL